MNPLLLFFSVKQKHCAALGRTVSYGLGRLPSGLEKKHWPGEKDNERAAMDSLVELTLPSTALCTKNKKSNNQSESSSNKVSSWTIRGRGDPPAELSRQDGVQGP